MFKVFNENLRYLRNAKKLSQKNMADLLNIQQATYARYENGDRQPSLETVVVLANFFGVSTDYLLGVENKKSSTHTSKKISQEDIELLENIKNLPERDKKIIDTFITTNKIPEEKISSGK